MSNVFCGFIDAGYLRAQGSRACGIPGGQAQLRASACVDWLQSILPSPAVGVTGLRFLRAYWYDGALEPQHADASRQELAELVNAWVFEHRARSVELDANYVGKLEQGAIRWPQDPDRRAGLRAVLGAGTDAELGFRRPRRTRIYAGRVDRHEFIRATLSVTAGAALGSSAIAELIAPLKPTPVPAVAGMTHVNEVRAVASAGAGDVRRSLRRCGPRPTPRPVRHGAHLSYLLRSVRRCEA